MEIALKSTLIPGVLKRKKELEIEVTPPPPPMVPHIPHDRTLDFQKPINRISRIRGEEDLNTFLKNVPGV